MANLDLGNPKGTKQKISDTLNKGFNDFIFLALDHISKKEMQDRTIAYQALQNEVKNSTTFSDPTQFQALEDKLTQAHFDYGHDKTTEAALSLLDDSLQRIEDTFTLNTGLKESHIQTETLLHNSNISLKEKTAAALDLLTATNTTIENSKGQMTAANLKKLVKDSMHLSEMHKVGSMAIQADKKFGATIIDEDEESPTFGQLIATPEMDVPLEVFDEMMTALQFGDLGTARRKSAKIDSYHELIEKNNVIGPVEEQYNVLKDNIYYTGKDLAKGYLIRQGEETSVGLRAKERAVYNALQLSTGTGTDKVVLTRTSIPSEIKKIESQVNNFLDPSVAIVEEIKNVNAEKAYRTKGLKGLVGWISAKALETSATGGYENSWEKLDFLEKRKLIGDVINFTDTIGVPGSFETTWWSAEGTETDFLKDFLIQQIDSVDILTTLQARLIAGQNNPSIYREHIE